MKKIMLIIGALLIFLTGTAWPGEVLKIFTWSEYMDEVNMPKNFEEITGIKVQLAMYESNEEMMAKLQAGGLGQYDLIIPSNYIIPSLIHLKLLTPLDHSKLPNLKNLSEKFASPAYDPGNKYTAGWQWGTVGFMYNKKKLSEDDVKSWSILFDSKKNPGSFYL